MWKKVREVMEVEEAVCDWSDFHTRELSTTSRKGFSGSSSVCTCKKHTPSTQQPTPRHLLPSPSVGGDRTWGCLYVL